jgi:hypothetical protein
MCGPYQGRMEKLDKPYKRDGKKITHRVVCGKVRKMRGGQPDFSIIQQDIDKELNYLKGVLNDAMKPTSEELSMGQKYTKTRNYTRTRNNLVKSIYTKYLQMYRNKLMSNKIDDPLINNRIQINNNISNEFNEYVKSRAAEIIPELLN